MENEVTVRVKTYDDPETQDLKVHSHWSYGGMVVLEIDGRSITVVAERLKNAVSAATTDRNRKFS